MATIWKCETVSNSEYYKKIEDLSEPSIDLIDRFKKEIVTLADPLQHDGYVQCDHAEKSKGCLLFVLRGRVELLIRPDSNNHKLYFVDCDDI